MGRDRTRSAVRALRRDNGLTQRDLGQLVGRSQSVVSRWERGLLAPTIPDLAILSVHLGQPIDALAAAFCGPGRRRSRRGDSAAKRRQIGLALRTARQTAELDRWTVARRTGITPRRLHRLEGGAQPSMAEFAALAAVLSTLVDLISDAGLDTE